MSHYRPRAVYNERMINISVQDLERDLLTFLRRVEAGESFLVVSGAHPLAEVRPVAGPATEPRPVGLRAGVPQGSIPAASAILRGISVSPNGK